MDRTKYIIQAVFKSVNAKKFQKQLRKVEGRVNKTGKNTKKAAKAQDKMNKGMKKGASMGSQLTKALKRAAIVAPVWMLLRSAMMQVIATIKEGFQYWMEFDKAMRKAEQVMHNVTGSMQDAVGSLTDEIRQLSKESGKTMADLTNTFYRFGTVGLDTAKAQEGMIASTKLATVMFGNNEQIAKVLASTYRLLGDNIDSTVPEMKKMEVMGGMIYKLWQTNAFEIDEFTSALERFLPVANMFNMQVDETMALMASLHTAAVRGSRAGRLLGSGLQRLVGNLDQVGSRLGIKVNPELEGTTSALMKVLGRVKELNDEGRKIPDIEYLTMFGGVRQRRAPQALIAIFDTLVDNMKAVNLETGKYEDLLDDVDKKYGEILDSVHKQVEIFKNLKKQAGEAFVKGLVGGEDFKQSMKNLNVIMENHIIPGLEKTGKVMAWLGKTTKELYTIFDFVQGGFLRWKIDETINVKKAEKKIKLLEDAVKGLHGELDKEAIFKLIVKIEEEDVEKDVSEQLRNQLKEKAGMPYWEKDIGEVLEIKTPKDTVVFAEDLEKLYDEKVKEIQDKIKKKEIKPGEVILGDPTTGFAYEVYVDELRKATSDMLKIGDNYWRQQHDMEKQELDESIAIYATRVKNIQEEIRKGKIEPGVVRLEVPGTDEVRAIYADTTKLIKEQKEQHIEIDKKIEEKINLLKQELKYNKMTLYGYSEMEISQAKLIDYISEQVRLFNETDAVQAGRVKAANKEAVLAAALKSDYEEIKRIFNATGIEDEKLLEIEKQRQEIVKNQLDLQQGIYKSLTSHVENMLQMQEVSTVEQIKSKMALEEKLGLNQDVLSVLDKELELQRAITQEELDRNKATSETVKLWKIARAFGTGTANAIASALESGNLSALTGQTRKVAAYYFKGPMEQDLASDYWGTGDVVGDMRAESADKPEQIMAQSLQSLPEQLKTAMQQFTPIIQPQFDVINNIQIDGAAAGEALKRFIVKSVETEIKNKNSSLRKAERQSVQEDINKGELK